MPKEPKEQKSPKPKPIAKVDLTIYDNGQISGDYYIWEEDDIGRRKKWTSDGTDFFKFLNRMQQNNIPVIAAAFNCQIVRAGLPIDFQGPWLMRGADGKLELCRGDSPTVNSAMGAAMVDGVVSKAPLEISHRGDQIADEAEVAAAREIGLGNADIKAALPDNKAAQGLPTAPVAPPAPPIPGR